MQLNQNEDPLLKPKASSSASNVTVLLPSVASNVTMPMPTISALDLLELHFAKACSLKEVDIYLGVGEGMKLLKTTARSRKVLTDVFLKKRSVYDGTGLLVERFQNS